MTALRLLVPGYIMLEECAVKAYRPLDVCNITCRSVSPLLVETFGTLTCFLSCCSVFGEDALVNVSVEKKDDNDGKLAGYIRIRSKTQGIALSLGDRITSVQRGLPEKQ